MTEEYINKRLKKIKIQLKDASESLNPKHYQDLINEYNKLLAIKIPIYGSDGD